MTRTRVGRWGRGNDPRRSRCPQRARQQVVPPPVFGGFCQYVESTALVTTSSTTYLNALQLATVLPVTGQWYVHFGANFQNETGSGDCDIRCSVDAGATVLFEENGNTAGQGVAGNLSPVGSHMFGGGPVAITAGAHTLDLDFRRTGGGVNDDVAMYWRFIELWYWGP